MKKKTATVAFACLVLTLAGIAAAASSPDLKLLDITFKQLTNCTNSTALVRVNTIVMNIGNDSSSNFTDSMTIQDSGSFGFFVSTLDAGDFTVHHKTVNKLCGTPFAVNASTDVFNQVSESNELNNFRSESFTPN